MWDNIAGLFVVGLLVLIGWLLFVVHAYAAVIIIVGALYIMAILIDDGTPF